MSRVRSVRSTWAVAMRRSRDKSQRLRVMLMMSVDVDHANEMVRCEEYS